MNETDTPQREVDFTIARGLSDTQIVAEVREFLIREGPGDVKLDRETLNTHLSTELRLSKRDAACLFTGLVLNDAASEISGGELFADYTFEANTEQAVEVLESQYVARQALDDVGFWNDDSGRQSAQLTGTFPPAMEDRLPGGVEPLAGSLRRLFFEANSSVRIASPYFDPSPAVVGDIVGMVNRGVRVRILTRETEAPDRNLRLALNQIHEELDSARHGLFRVRDLYEQDKQTGEQTHATHAKIAIKDREVCYIGSANLTDTSLFSNFELGVLLRDDTVTTAVDIFDTVFDFSQPVDLPI